MNEQRPDYVTMLREALGHAEAIETFWRALFWRHDAVGEAALTWHFEAEAMAQKIRALLADVEQEKLAAFGREEIAK